MVQIGANLGLFCIILIILDQFCVIYESGKAREPFIFLASRTGFEPVLPP